MYIHGRAKKILMSNAFDSIPDEKIHDAPRHGGVFSGYTVMAKSLLGSGMLSIAFACSKAGLILGLVLLIFAAIITWISLHVLSKLCLEFNSENLTFYSMTERIAPRAKWFLDVAIIVDCVGSAIGFLQMIGKLMTLGISEIFGLGSFTPRTMSILIESGVVLLLFPILMMKEISDTKIVNLLGLACLFYVSLLPIIFSDVSNYDSSVLVPKGPWSAISAFPVFIFAFSCQQNLLSVVTEMQSPDIKKLNMVTLGAIGTGIIFYLPVSILPVLTFGRTGANEDTFLQLLDKKNVAVQIGYFCASLAVAISYVLIVHPVRRSVMSLMYGSNFPVGKQEFKIRLIITSAVAIVTLGVALAAGSTLGPTVEFTALLGATTCGFVMPFFLYLKHFGYSSKSVLSVTVAGLFLFCLLLYPIGITASVLGILKID
jgi:amino acid permease